MYSKIWAIILCLLLALVCLAGCGGGKQAAPTSTRDTQPQAALDQTWTLAVFPFDTTGKSRLSGEEVMNLLTADLSGLAGIKVVDREAFQEILNQVGFGMGDLADPANRSKVARLLVAELLCFGTVNRNLKLATARVNFTETGETLISVKATDKSELKNVEALAQKLGSELRSPRFVAFLNEQSEEPEDTVEPPETVEVKGYGAIIDGDLIMAKELAQKDAYSRAIEEVCGVKLSRKTQVENFQLVRDRILTESIGFITSYDILDEIPDSELGYEVTVRATVSKEPISDLDQLKLVVNYLLARPRVAVLIEGEAKGEELKEGRAQLIAGQIATRLQKAGFDVVDIAAIEEKKKELADSGDESAARLASLLDAKVTVRGSIATDITGRIEEIGGKKLDFPMITATTTGVMKIVLADTAEVVSVFNHEDLPPKSNTATGTTEDSAVGKSVDSFIQVSAEKLAWELAKSLGEPVSFHLELHGVSLEQAQEFKKQLEKIPEQITIDPEMLQYGDGIADYKLKTTLKSQELQQKLLNLIDPAALDAEELVPEKVKPGTIRLSLKV